MSDEIVYEDMTLEKAVNFVKRSRNRAIFLSCSQFAKSEDQSGAQEGYTRGWNVNALVKVSAPSATRYLQDAYTRAGDKGGLVHMGWSSNCLFIGSST